MASLPDGVIFTMESADKGTAVKFNFLQDFVFCKNCKYHAQDMVCNHPVEWGNEESRNHCNPEWFCADGERMKE